jgi:hypothetical protein
MTMDFDPKFLLDLVQWVFMGGLAVLMWARKPGEDAGSVVAEMRIELARVQERLALQEGSVLQTLKVQERRLERLEDFFMSNFRSDDK